MLLENGKFDINSNFTYDKSWADDIFYELLENNRKIYEYAKAHNLENKLDKCFNVFKERAERYDPYNENQQDEEEVKTDKYFSVYNSMYEYKPLKNLWGQEKPFSFTNEFDRVASTFGLKRNLIDKAIITPYFVPLDSDEITNALFNLERRLEFEWQAENPLAIISKIVPYITAVQPLVDGNHRASHAMIQYYLGKTGLPSITRNKHLKEHYEAFTNFEKDAILTGNINDLIAYYYYNVLERQEQICSELGALPQDVLTSKAHSTPDKEIV